VQPINIKLKVSHAQRPARERALSRWCWINILVDNLDSQSIGDRFDFPLTGSTESSPCGSGTTEIRGGLILDLEALAEPLVSMAVGEPALLGTLVCSLALAQPTRFREDNDISTLIIGGIAYAFILAMAATSFDRSAAWLGPRRWKILHTVGSYYIWATFAIVLVTIALEVPHYWVGVALLVLALLLRLLARWTQRRKSFVARTPAASPQ
jgi:hypothetical protein